MECPECGGDVALETCPECDGAGGDIEGYGVWEMWQACGLCGGWGNIYTCLDCGYAIEEGE